VIHENFRCEFYFIRHGESQSNATPGVAVGANFDSPLTERGAVQAALLGRRLMHEGIRFDRIYSSTMTRAVRTTEIMLEEMGEAARQFEKVKALMEQQIPAWRGKREEEIFTPELRATMASKVPDFVPADGEPMRLVERRVTTWLENEIIFNRGLVSRAQSLRVAIVGHSAATKCMFHYIMGFDAKLITRIGMGNCSISRFLFNKDGWYPLCINDAAHVGGGFSPGGEGRVTR